MILSAQTIRGLCVSPWAGEPEGSLAARSPGALAWRPMLDPFVERQQHELSGCSFGLSSCGYDVRLAQDRTLARGDFLLASTMERFMMPRDVMARVCDKSTWARRGLAVQTTVIEPGWEGYLTLELTNHGPRLLTLRAGTPIAQIIFERLDEPTEQPYPEDGKYQRQENKPVEAR
jgi:dCTP deaminase